MSRGQPYHLCMKSLSWINHVFSQGIFAQRRKHMEWLGVNLEQEMLGIRKKKKRFQCVVCMCYTAIPHPMIHQYRGMRYILHVSSAYHISVTHARVESIYLHRKLSQSIEKFKNQTQKSNPSSPVYTAVWTGILTVPLSARVWVSNQYWVHLQTAHKTPKN